MQIEPTGDEPVIVARSLGPHGEVALRRRGSGRDAVDELIVNGTFAMDSADTASERALAQLAFPPGSVRRRVLIGGLGLGYTAAAALDLTLDHTDLVQVDVVEIEPALVKWAGVDVTPTLSRVARDPRTHLIVDDIAHALTGPVEAEFRTWDAILLDVDNGPDFLIHTHNASLYTVELLSAAYSRLVPGGRLAIWCQGPSPLLMDTLSAIGATARQHLFETTRGQRQFRYAICTLDRPPTSTDAAE